ncbi:MAG TPA: hypothetical protein VFB21_23125 [Chthonomonadaceae bacterium]|nr:hypothetical protein [Chthonomonadaceae bacterium]
MELKRAPARLSEAARNWWQTRQLYAWLSSESEAEREAALAYCVAQGPAALPRLQRALHGPITLACGATLALARLGDREALRRTLARCYEEEWLLRCVRDGHIEGLHALRWLGRGRVGEALREALDAAASERDPQLCLNHLASALGALRALVIFDGVSPQAWWERAMHYGPHCLHWLHRGIAGAMARSLTAHVRSVGVRGLLLEYPAESFRALACAAQSDDLAVVHTAILGLHRLGDKRALPVLQSIAFTPRHPLAHIARVAIEELAGAKSDPLALLRAAQPEVEPEELLRPALAFPGSLDDAVRLIRPVR